MSRNYPYVSDEYRHLLGYQQQPQPSQMRNNPIVYHPNNNGYHNSYQPPNVYIHQQQYQQQQQYPHYNPQQYNPQQQQQHYNPQQQQQYNLQSNSRYNHNSYAAEQPNNNQYPTLQPAKQLTPDTDNKTQLIHKVEYGDTLQGLSLVYDVAISKIKQRNNIEGDSIYYLKQIIIPNPKAQPLQGAKTQQFLIQQFMTYMPLSEKSQKIARYYLEQHDWVVDAGVKAFKEDLEWEKKNKVQYKSIPLAPNQQGNVLNYTQQELIQKKYR